MNITKFIDKLLTELSLRVKEGYPILDNKEHIRILSDILREWGLGDEAHTFIYNLTEADEKRFRNPILNKEVEYVDDKGNKKVGLVGNLLRLQKDTAGRKAAERLLPAEGSEERKEINRELGGENQPNRDDISGSEKFDSEDGETPQTPAVTVFDKETKGGEEYLKNLPDNDPAKPDEFKTNSEETKSGGVIYPVGDGYYADTPNGKPKYKKAVDEIIDTNHFLYILESEAGETVVTKQIANSGGEYEKVKVIDDTEGKIIADKIKAEKQILNRVEQQIKKNSVTLSDEEKKVAYECFSETQKLFDPSISDEEKISIATQLRDKYKITTNSSNTKYYINALGKNRKIFGDGTKSTEKLVEQIKKYTQLDQIDFSGIKKALTAAAKPNFGKEFEVKSSDNENVNKLFNSSPILRRINSSYHSIYAPKDGNGNIQYPSNKYAKEYLKQSFENPSLTNTIELVKSYVESGSLSKEYLNALETHQMELNSLLQKYEAPSAELADAIVNVYNNLMVGLNNADSEAASSIMKQLAENRLYEEELARGEEVYLPSNGSFPAGDKIKVAEGTLETVSLVSCKFGKIGRIYGCPANMKSITQLHPDESKRDLFGQYVGEDNYTLMIKDELIDGGNEEETQLKVKELIGTSLTNQNLSNIFDDSQLEDISKICSEYYYKIKQLKTTLKNQLKDVKSDVFWGEFQNELASFKKQYQSRLQKIVTADKIDKIVGENNTPNFKTRLSPDVFLSVVLLTENIRSSNGYGLEHNKQYYDENGTPTFKTEMGTDIPNDYSITVRNERTRGRNGGGLQLSFTGDSERVGGEILPD